VAHRQRVEETGNRPLEMVAAQILDSNLEHGGDCRFDRPPDPRRPTLSPAR
jgi:hypothetical protein